MSLNTAVLITTPHLVTPPPETDKNNTEDAPTEEHHHDASGVFKRESLGATTTSQSLDETTSSMITAKVRGESMLGSDPEDASSPVIMIREASTIVGGAGSTSSSTANPDEMLFPVIKKHHARRWLKQHRILRITNTEIENCKDIGEGKLAVTKSHKMVDLITVTLNDRQTFTLEFVNDHQYIYRSITHAVAICTAVTQRSRCAKAGRPVTGQTQMEHNELLPKRIAFREKIERSVVSRRSPIYLKAVDQIMALRKRNVQGESVGKSEIVDVMKGLRLSLDDERHSLAHEWSEKTNGVSWQYDEGEGSYDEMLHTIEDGLQRKLLRPPHRLLFLLLEQCPPLQNDVDLFCSVPDNEMIMQSVYDELPDKHKHLTFEHALKSATKLDDPRGFPNNTCPMELQRIISEIMRNTILECDPSQAATTDDLLPMLIYILCKSRGKYHPLIAIYLESLADWSDCTENGYYLTLYTSAVFFIVKKAKGEESQLSPA
eukprot:PhF_6_TR15089/c0_g1_i1/m.23736